MFIRHTAHGGIAEVSDRALRTFEALGWERVMPPAKKALAKEWRQYALLIDEGNRTWISDATRTELIDRYGTEQPTDQAEGSAESSEENI
jgi:hypothetical protein